MVDRGILPALAVALLATACSPSPRPAEPARTLEVLMGADVPSLEPHAEFEEVSSAVLTNLYESLVRFDSNLQVAPGLAQRWINPDDRTWRFFLDPDARFADGRRLGATDVKRSLERLRSLAGSQVTGFARRVTAVTVVDEHTVDLHTDAPMGMLNDLAFIPIVADAPGGGEGAAAQPLGTGPYRLAAWDKGKTIVLEANPHRRDQPPFRRVVFTLRPEGVTLDEALARRPHLVLYPRRAEAARLRQGAQTEYELVTAGGLSVYYVAFNLAPRLPGGADNPLRDLRVRRALALALDRDALVRPALGFRPTPHLIVPQVFGFDPAIAAPARDVAAARALLAEAGPRRAPIPFDVVEGAGHALEHALVEQWAAVGAEVRLVEHPSGSYESVLESGAFGLVLQGYGCTSGDAGELLTFCLRTRDDGAGLGAGNYGRYSNPEVDAIAESQPRELDTRKRQALLRRALRLVSEELPYVPVMVSEDLYLVSRSISFEPPLSIELFRASEISPRRGDGAGR